MKKAHIATCSYSGSTCRCQTYSSIIVPPSALQITGKGVVESTLLTLTCTVQANPAPVMTWLKRSDGGVTVILNSARISITTQHMVDDAISTSILSINRAEPGDQGDYVCEARNALINEVSMKNVSLKIKGKVSNYNYVVLSYRKWLGNCMRQSQVQFSYFRV